MKEIVKVLLQEGIDEETIHEVLDIIQESNPEVIGKSTKKRYDNYTKALNDLKNNYNYENAMKYMEASNKLERNVGLANRHYNRKGDSNKSSFKMKSLQDRAKIAKALDQHAAAKSIEAAFGKGTINKKANAEAEKWEGRANRYMQQTNTIPRNVKDLKRVVKGS